MMQVMNQPKCPDKPNAKQMSTVTEKLECNMA